MSPISTLPSDEDIRAQRDRFIAFCFAASDLAFEVGPDGTIIFASGAAKELTGNGIPGLVGRPWLELFAAADRALLTRTLKGTTGAARCGPLQVTIEGASGAAIGAFLSMCRLPTHADSVYCVISLARVVPGGVAAPAEDRENQAGLLDRKGFTEAAQKTLEAANAVGKSVELTLFELTGLDELQDRVGPERMQEFETTLGAVLRSRSIAGGGAGKLSDEKYGVIHDASVNAADIELEVLELSREFDPATEVSVDRGTVDLDGQGLSEEEAARTLIYTINHFATATAEDFTIGDLKRGFQDLAQETTRRVSELKSRVTEGRFGFAVQPIVDLATRATHHYELLLRLEPNQSPHPWIALAEGVGFVEELDLAVCRWAVERLSRQRRDGALGLAVNLSGRSLSRPAFIDELYRLLDRHPTLQDRLIFEITESFRISDLAAVNEIVGGLKHRGYRICLDDFGAGAASFEYLQGLHVDFVKIDGAYVRRLVDSSRDSKMLEALASLCRDLKIRTIAEMVEHEEQASALQDLGIECGQGYLFCRPVDVPGPGIRVEVPAEEALDASKLARGQFVASGHNPFTGQLSAQGRGRS